LVGDRADQAIIRLRHEGRIVPGHVAQAADEHPPAPEEARVWGAPHLDRLGRIDPRSAEEGLERGGKKALAYDESKGRTRIAAGGIWRWYRTEPGLGDLRI
jgi:hypothetical protein